MNIQEAREIVRLEGTVMLNGLTKLVEDRVRGIELKFSAYLSDLSPVAKAYVEGYEAGVMAGAEVAKNLGDTENRKGIDYELPPSGFYKCNDKILALLGEGK